MTSIRYGIRTTLRAKGRTRLFALLIFILTLALVLGVGIWTYCEQLLTRIEDTYTSIVLAEYMGEDYPDENAADEQAREAFAALDNEAIAAIDGVTLWENPDVNMAVLPGYKGTSSNVPYSDYGVVVVSKPVDMDNGSYTGRISKALYTREGKEGISVFLNPVKAIFHSRSEQGNRICSTENSSAPTPQIITLLSWIFTRVVR